MYTAQLCDVRTGLEGPPGAGLSSLQLPRLRQGYSAARFGVLGGVLQDITIEVKFYYGKLRK